MSVRHEYLNSYTSDFYKFGISLQRSYISITSNKENAYVPVSYMIFYSQKLRDPRKFCFYHPGSMGVMLVIPNFLAADLPSYFGVKISLTLGNNNQ